MSAGIYKLNGNYAYAMNLEKKLKRKKGAEIVEVYDGEPTEEDLQEMLNKYSDIKKEVDNSNNTKLYHFKNKKTKETISSIYPNLDHLNINNSDWE